MKTLKTTLVLFCLFGHIVLNAQFEKGAKLLEGGIRLHLDNTIGEDDIDLSTDGTLRSLTDLDQFGTHFSFGRFLSDKQEIGFTTGYNWSKFSITSISTFSSGFFVSENTTTHHNLSVGVYYRRYYPFLQRLFGGYTLGLGTGNTWTKSTNTNLQFPTGETFVNKSNLLNANLSGNLFLGCLFTKRLGGRLSFGTVDIAVSKDSDRESTDVDISLDLNSTVFPTVSFFWLINGKSSDNRD